MGLLILAVLAISCHAKTEIPTKPDDHGLKAKIARAYDQMKPLTDYFAADDREANIRKIHEEVTLSPQNLECGMCFECDPWCPDCMIELYQSLSYEQPELHPVLEMRVGEWIFENQENPKFSRILDSAWSDVGHAEGH